MNTQRQALRRMLATGELVVAPGAYDGATAMLVQASGFDAVYMTGAGVSSTYGLPDYGLLTMTEMAEHAGRVARAVTIPAIVDADTGYGNELNVTRTIQEFEARGVAGLHIEDQVSPKRCGHLLGKEIVPREEFLSKIRAAVAARRDPDLLIIARTDARGVADMDEAIARGNLALEAGADMAFVEATQSLEEAAAVPSLIHGPCMLNMVIGGVTPVFDIAVARQMGYRLVIAPGAVLGTMVTAVMKALGGFRETGLHPVNPGNLTPKDVFDLFGAEAWDALRRTYDSGTD
uniref:Carboxyvinyl-carboxyphosphonate phosphorylmutase n=1 Tax=Caulobacter sp. (strain K31) TaxID=366602 RepID=B0T6M6_CAUSK